MIQVLSRKHFFGFIINRAVSLSDRGKLCLFYFWIFGTDSRIFIKNDEYCLSGFFFSITDEAELVSLFLEGEQTRQTNSTWQQLKQKGTQDHSNCDEYNGNIKAKRSYGKIFIPVTEISVVETEISVTGLARLLI